MNEHTKRLLELTPGIVRRRSGIIQEQIGLGDWMKMLRLGGHGANVNVGNWVRVHKGTYRGDVGYVVAVELRRVPLLLVPCLLPPHLASLGLKRKCSAPTPEPALFNPNAIPHIYGVPAALYDDGTYRFNSHIYNFEHGLIQMELDLHSVSLALVLLTAHFVLFQQARHPALLSAQYPCPLEWSCDEDECVCI
jgi:hypothetical protein